MKQVEATNCECHLSASRVAKAPEAAAKKTARSMLGVLPSILLALFPRCPVCLAAYLSMFGSVWLARSPYVAGLFPVLLALSGLNLALLLKKAPQKGYRPFLLSLAGAVVILGTRSVLPQDRWIVVLGMALMLSGSLLNSFSVDHFQKPAPNLARKQDPSCPRPAIREFADRSRSCKTSTPGGTRSRWRI